MVTITGTVTDSVGSSAGWSASAIQSTGGGLPPGVTLQAIDGEIMLTSTTMSNNYYARNGFTYASNPTYNSNYLHGWDSANFFPIGAWQANYFQAADVTTHNQLHWNVVFHTSDVNFDFCRANKMYLIYNPGTTVDGTGPGAETVGLLSADENYSASLANIASTPLAKQNNRWWWLQNTWQIFNTGHFGVGGSIGGTSMTAILSKLNPAPGSTTRHFDVNSADTYWFTGSKDGGMLGSWGAIYGTGAFTADQGARAHFYGDLIDWQRTWQAGSFPAPILQFVETCEPGNSCTNAAYIQPAELNAAAWSIIIHGGRMICYFDHTFCGTNQTGEGVQTTYLQTASNYPTGIGNPNGISMNAQIAATDLLIQNMAPIINSPFALGFASVTPVGYVFPVPNGNISTNGIDVCTHWYQGGAYTNSSGTFSNGFYIFAQPRASRNTTNISATFTVASGSVATVVGENRNINIVSGKFTDIFASGLTVHIYQIS